MTRRAAVLIVVLAACGGGSTTTTPSTTAPTTTTTAPLSTSAGTTTTSVAPTTTTTLIDGPVDVLALAPFPLLMSSFGPTGVGPAPAAGLTMALVVLPQASAAPPGPAASRAGVSTVIGVFGAAEGFDADCLGFVLWADDFSSRYVDGYAPLTEDGCGDPGGPIVAESQVLLVTERTIVIQLGILPGGSFAPAFQVQNTAGDAGFYSVGQDLFVDPGTVPVLVAGLVVAFGGDLLAVQGSAVGVVDAPPWDAGDCAPDETSLCFGRFRVSAEHLADGVSVGPGAAVPFGTAHEGGFRFGAQEGVDVLVKLVNGCDINDRVWVLVAPLAPIETVVSVTDVGRGSQRTYPSTDSFAPLVDTEAFATCP